jgi:cell division protease FtsH
MTFEEDEGEVFLGRSVTQHKNVSDDTAAAIDEEIRAILERNYTRATEILRARIDTLHAMADALMRFETIDKDQIDDLMAGRPVRTTTAPPVDRPAPPPAPAADASPDGAPSLP